MSSNNTYFETDDETTDSYRLEDHQSSAGGSDELEEARKIAAKETYYVSLWRFITTDILIAITCGLVLSTYALMRDGEYQDFERAYADSSEALVVAVRKQHIQNVAAIVGFASSISSTARTVASSSSILNDATPTWPFFQPPDFQGQADSLKKVSNIDSLYFAPLVSNEDLHSYMSFVDDKIATETSGDWKGYHPYITSFDSDGAIFVRHNMNESNHYFPTLASSPLDHSHEIINWNLADLVATSTPNSTPSQAADDLLIDALALLQSNETLLVPPPEVVHIEPKTYMISPIYQDDAAADGSGVIVGVVAGGHSWTTDLSSVLPDHSQGSIDVVVTYGSDCQPADQNSTEISYTYEVMGQIAVLKGNGDLHDTHYDEYQVDLQLRPGVVVNNCGARIAIYPTRSLEVAYRTPFPEVYSLVLAATLIIIAAAFFRYNVLVDRRNEKLVEKFARSNAIVTSLFPKTFAKKLMGNDDDDDKDGKNGDSTGKLKTLMSKGDAKQSVKDSKPLADIFPEVSVIFADIAGFTAWASVREPHQVFKLLETLYGSFDACAKKRRIFKVETIGDSYVAASGIPDPRRDHAVALVRFGCDIIHQMQVLTRSLEVELGPDTGDLSLRVGIHSGTVTAGILRGQKARFQLFGNAMNTAARMESNGIPGRVQISQATADLLIQSGREHWLQKREEKIAAKGLGLVQTYFVVRTDSGPSSTTGSESLASDDEASTELAPPGGRSRRTSGRQRHEPKTLTKSQTKELRVLQDGRNKRLVDWNVETLLRLIRQIEAYREANQDMSASEKQIEDEALGLVGDDDLVDENDGQRLPLQDVKECLSLRARRSVSPEKQVNPDTIEVSAVVVDQLRDFVDLIARHYNNNEFHNFEHASHVVMSVTKLMARIVDSRDEKTSADGRAAQDGIASDPLTQFAVVFAALIHDVDHLGVPNAQLVKEKVAIAEQYNNRSVAEQHSFDLAWGWFMSEQCKELRETVCPTASELKRLREIIVNAVMATDIADRNLKALRNARWEKAFTKTLHEDEADTEQWRDTVNRKATIVMEHLMQASDVSHTMQHWHIYRKWNERFLRECYRAYQEGRAEKNPLDGWYKGEIGFFDFYVIPLAKKLADCGVFGVSSHEYLDYARQNRAEWEQRGQEVVASIARDIEREEDASENSTARQSKLVSTLADVSNKDRLSSWTRVEASNKERCLSGAPPSQRRYAKAIAKKAAAFPSLPTIVSQSPHDPKSLVELSKAANWPTLPKIQLPGGRQDSMPDLKAMDLSASLKAMDLSTSCRVVDKPNSLPMGESSKQPRGMAA